LSIPFANPIVAAGLEAVMGALPFDQISAAVRSDARLVDASDDVLAELVDEARTFWQQSAPAPAAVVYPALTTECAKDRVRALRALRDGAAPAQQQALDARLDAWITLSAQCLVDFGVALIAATDPRPAFNHFAEAEIAARSLRSSDRPRSPEIFCGLYGQLYVNTAFALPGPNQPILDRLRALKQSSWWAAHGPAEQARMRSELERWTRARREARASQATDPRAGARTPLIIRLHEAAQRVADGGDVDVSVVPSLGEGAVQDAEVALAEGQITALVQHDPGQAVAVAELLMARLKLPQAAASPFSWALAEFALGNALLARGQRADNGQPDFARASGLLRSSHDRVQSDPRMAGEAALRLGIAEYGLGEYAAARDWATVAITTLSRQTAPSPLSVGAAYGNRAEALEALADPVGALRDYAQAHRLFVAARQGHLSKQALNAVIRVGQRTGHLDEALAAGRLSMELVTSSAGGAGAARTAIMLVRTALLTGRLDVVDDLLDSSERLLEPTVRSHQPDAEQVQLYGDLQFWRAVALSTLAGPGAAREFYEDAIARLERARLIAVQAGDDNRLARCLVQMGLAAVRAELFPEAVRFCEMLELVRAPASELARAEQVLGMVHLRAGDAATAVERLRAALDRAAGQDDRVFSVRALLGDAQLALGRPAAAREEYEEAIAAFERARELLGDESRVGYQASASATYGKLVRLHTGELHDAARAFHWVERAKSRAFVELLGLTSIPTPEAPDDVRDLLDREREQLDRVHALRSALLARDAPDDVAGRLELHSAGRQLDSIWDELAHVLPDYVALRTGAAVDWRAVQAQLAQ
jgi:tetratricopeptide (TPR) repeat protein